MTKEKLIKNLRDHMDEFSWCLDDTVIRDLVLERFKKDLDLLLEISRVKPEQVRHDFSTLF